MLYSDSAGCYLLGCLCNNPAYIRSGKYPLTPDDFEPNLLHKYLYAVIHNLALKGLEEITEIEIDQFIQPYAVIREKIEDDDGLLFIRTVKEQTVAGNIDLYYPIIRKFSLLRYAQEHGTNIDEIFDQNGNFEEEMAKLNKYSINDILNKLDGRIVQLKKHFSPTNIRREMWAGEGFSDILTQFEKTPVMGAGLCSAYETSIFRGWQVGHLLLRSAPSGHGKSCRSIADLCNVCCTQLWDDEAQDFIDNPNCHGGGFFIHTEMDQETEIQPRFVSYIANIPLHTILSGKYNDSERKRLLKAAQILETSRIRLIDMPQFTIPLLRNTLKEMAITEGFQYGVFDYVQDNGIAGKIYKEETGTTLRQDMLLLAIVTDLKACAEEFGLGILSMTQLNGQEKTQPVIDEHCLFGSKSMKNKVDGGMIMLKPTQKELEQTATLNTKRGFNQNPPNIVTHVYKARFSEYGQNLKVFQYLDLGTGRLQDYYVTDLYNVPKHVPQTTVKSSRMEGIQCDLL